MSSDSEGEDTGGFAYSLASYSDLALRFGEVDVKVKCQKELCFTDAVSLLDGSADYTGQLSWKGSQLLGHYLASTHGGREKWAVIRGHQEVCVELGCGSGVGSIVAARTGCPYVVATDGDAAAIALADLNLRDSQVAGEATLLHWGAVGGKAFAEELASKKRRVGLVIASEVVYAESSVRPLLETVVALLSSARAGAEDAASSSAEPARFVLVHAPRSMKQEPVDRALFATAKELGFSEPTVVDLDSLKSLLPASGDQDPAQVDKREAADIGHSLKQLTREHFTDTKILIFTLL